MVVDELLDTLNGYGKRVLRLGAVMVDLHLNIAQREVMREQQRVVSGAMLLGLGSSFLMAFFILSQGVLVLWLYDTGRNWLLYAIALLGGNVLIGSLFAWLGLQSLKGPYMVETISQLSRTTAILTKNDI